MKEIITSIEISSTSKSLWYTLSDFDNYSKWNPFIVDVKGIFEEGSKIEIFVKTRKGNIRKYKPRITKLVEHKEIRWYGSSVLPGIFNSERIFQIDQINPSKVIFTHRARFFGIAVMFLSSSFTSELNNSFNDMNFALKKRVESEANQ